MMNFSNKFQFAIDRGGTFTDIYARCPDGKVRLMKLLSVDPQNYDDAPREGIRRIIEQTLGKPASASKPLDTKYIDYIRMGTTVATNALLERNGERMALCITEGVKDLLHIGNQSRPKIFDLRIEIPEVLYEDVVEVQERVILQQDKCELGLPSPELTGSTNEKLHLLTPLDETKLRKDLSKILAKGIRSLAVALMHSYTFSAHERRVGEIALGMGFTQVSLSCEVMPMVKIVPRGFTACVDAYLTPCIKQYLSNFEAGFDDRLSKVNVLFMQSDGGLTPMHRFNGSRAILSGPAGGVVGYAVTSYANGQPVIGFDMGGTSTDVSRYAGEYEHVFETTTAGVTIQAPQLDINTVAAGGGSRLFFRSGMFVVGPQSAGAHPGPTCYRKGGPLTVTDANLCLGRLLPDYFPKIFGPSEDQPLDVEATKAAFRSLTDEINSYMTSENPNHVNMSIEAVALGFIVVANESMCRPIRALTQAKGHDTSRHMLACFGGAGGQHACAIARSLGMGKVFIHKYSGILSAYGMALADVVEDMQEPSAAIYAEDSLPQLDKTMERLMKRCEDKLKEQGFSADQIQLEPFLNLRYDRTDCALMCPASSTPDNCRFTSKHGDFMTSFTRRYKTEFGFTIPDRIVRVDDVRVRGTGRAKIVDEVASNADGKVPRVEKVVQCHFDSGYHDTAVYLLEELSRDHVLHGPSIIIDKNGTVLVEPGCTAQITEKGDILIIVGTGEAKKVGVELDSINLSIFSHRFMSIAEQMGRILQRTSISTNIKERLDFSCALFGPDGGLVSNAPHIPVHLGAMQEAVQYQMRQLAGVLNEGDCILSNHPSAGGSHLPDLTVITPVFSPGHARPIFFLANRGHHADIGGATPGSMPPHSTSILEEGAVFKSFKLVKGGIFQEEELVAALNAPSKLPGCSGTRNLHDNLADLRAQVAANQRGIHLVNELIDSYGMEVVQAYMSHIQNNAELAVRDLLRDVAKRFKRDNSTSERTVTLEADDRLDDGSTIMLRIDINASEGSAVFDFSGTSPMVLSNSNAPRAITLSAIIYCLRSMVGYDVPLNQGCLKPVRIIIPKWSLLDPEENAAVVGGNVTTSQRVVDVIMKAFETCAASQGCMNNVTFGDAEVGYYETVAGGAGAGEGWNGRSGVHTHMTNTRITDPEILERRYPVMLQRFELNPGSGGRGMFSGGDGVVREIMFRKDLVLSVLSERRVFSPYGLNGGEPGKLGSNLLLRHNGPVINLGGKKSASVKAKDVFRMLTPGGGGWGSPAPSSDHDDPEPKRRKVASDEFVCRGSLYDYTQRQEAH